MEELVDTPLNKLEFVFENKSFHFAHADDKDHIFSIIRRSGEFYELELLSALRPLLRPGDWVVDVGANIGNHSIYFAGVCGCNVMAFEPNPTAARLLRKNIALNGLEDQIQVHEIALGSRDGTGQIVLHSKHNLGMAEIIRADDDGDKNTDAVRIGVLSDYIGSNTVHLLKIDTEGMDFEVLRGAHSIVERDRCAITIEASHRDDFIRISGLLEGLGYTASGSYNYTPTHLFVQDDGSQSHRVLSMLSRQSSLGYIDHAALRDTLNRGFHAANAHRDQLTDAIAHFTRAVLEKNDFLGEVVAQFSQTSEISEDRIGHIAHMAALWAEAGNLHDAAQNKTLALMRRDIEALKQQSLAHPDLPNSRNPLEPQENATRNSRNNTPDAPSVWQVVREGSSRPQAVTASSPTSSTPVKSGAIAQDREQIADIPFAGKWDGIGWANGTATLEAGGTVRAASDGEAGFVTQKFPVADGGLLEIEIEIADGASAKPVFSIVSETGEGIGTEVALGSGTTTVRAFAAGRTREIKLRIHARNTRKDDHFTVRRLTVSRIGIDAHQQAARARIGEPVLASMASIPSRRAMLGDAVNSLLAQCDRVRVFLNNYPDVPEFLIHPRVDVRRSQDWDDRGDAGKMFWLERDKQPGYRLIVDDDLIFPPDFSDIMCGKVAARGKKAIYATHGVIVRQPVSNYYDNRSRAATFHFGRELITDRRVHIGATNALCMHSNAVSMRWADFKYCNSADVWLALYAQQQDLQILTPARKRNWVRENQHTAPEETIYKHSLNRTRTRFDSSLVQDAVLKHNWPLTIRTGGGRKYALMLTLSRIEALASPVESYIARMQKTAGDAEWVVVFAFDRSDAALEEAVAEFRIERETHLIDTANENALTQTADLMQKTGIDAVLALDGETLVTGAQDGEALTGAKAASWGNTQLVKLKAGQRRTVAGAIITESKGDAADLLTLLTGVKIKPSSRPGMIASAIKTARPIRAEKAGATPTGQTINTVFQHVRVLNLDRRADRWESVTRSLALANIKAERFSAVDGSLPEVTAEYRAYLQQPPTTVSDSVPEICSQRDFYMDYSSQMARIAHLERTGKKAIASRGAWGYLKSCEAILEQALADNTESLLVLDDDVMLHKDTRALFAEAMTQLPDDWLILQLGTLQYNWAPPWMEPYSPLLYRTNGSAVGSHAVGMRFDVIPYLLDQVKRLDMPYDIGALSAATRAFAGRCFVITPNLAIQSLVDSDIGTSDFQQGNQRKEVAARYKWKLEDYR